jgi:hypothetical protein
MSLKIEQEEDRGFLKCLHWAGAAAVWSLTGGVPGSQLLGSEKTRAKRAGFTFVQISDNKPASPDGNGTLQLAVDTDPQHHRRTIGLCNRQSVSPGSPRGR